MEEVTMEATAHNLVIEIDFGEAPFRFDLKQKSASGATILHHRYVMNGQRNYSVSIAEGEARDEFDCAEVDATTMDCFWTYITPTDETTIGPLRLTKL
ncbi:MAG: hypothetical protein OXP69_23955 [Spirochaetaceae bacterium]|nr:hypothetical protein [Spirochaetaceae bacterium]